MEVKKGSIAVCAVGEIGIITSDVPKKVKVKGKVSLIWKGFYLENPKKSWQSRNPIAIGHIDDIIKKYENFK